MAAEVKKEIELEIAHVLFTDIVGYSKLPIHQQRAVVERLNEIVRGTDEFQAAESGGRLITIPTGDGVTLVFYHSPEAPVECALEISRALKEHPELQLRMGIHSGPVSGVIDATGKANVAGAGINIAQRVMDCGDAEHILLSKHVAEDLEEYPHWQPHLHELGECEVKHGVRVSVVNLYTAELGNPAVPEKLKAARVAAAARKKRAGLRRLSLGILTLLATVAAISFLLLRYKKPPSAPGLVVPEKSIAVLPFENRSEDKANAEQLRAHLSDREEQVIAAKPTDNPEAYDAYLRGLAYTLKAGANDPVNALGAQKYLKEAVRLDPKFALAWALLSYVDALGYLTQNLQPTVALREEARQAADTALTLQPNLGEAILAKGYYHYSCLKDYDTAVRYFEQARPLLPNSSRIPEYLAYVERRRGQWERSESYFNEAEKLDPRNAFLLTQHALSYQSLRRFPEALRKLDQVLNITPDDIDTLVFKAATFQAEGDLPRAAALLAPLHPSADQTLALETQVGQAILERRPAPIIARLKEILAKPDAALGNLNGELRFWLGWAQEVAGDHAAAQESWKQARSELEPFLKQQPENWVLIGDLALTNMGLGDKTAAFAFVEKAIAVNPIEKDPMDGPGSIEILARVTARMGEPDRAISALQELLSTPYESPLNAANVPLTSALLRLDPMFDPLRNDPRFQKLAGSAPK